MNMLNSERLFPITFSIPECKISGGFSNKTKLLSSLIPGVRQTYIYNNETDYYNEYKQSYFAITTKKGGWDCLRHYEIIANGCIPFFPNIKQCPPNTMYLLPKNLLVEGNLLYAKYNNIGIHNMSDDAVDECKQLSNKLLEHLQNNLTTRKMAEYILNKTKHESANKILFLSGDTSPDYLRCLTLHGFKTLFEENCHDYPIIPHIYKLSNFNYNALYGKGITYTNLLERTTHNDEYDKTIEQDIMNHKYDLVIYGSYHRGTPYLDLVSRHYEQSNVIFICGEDIGTCTHHSHMELVNKGFNVFVREL